MDTSTKNSQDIQNHLCWWLYVSDGMTQLFPPRKLDKLEGPLKDGLKKLVVPKWHTNDLSQFAVNTSSLCWRLVYTVKVHLISGWLLSLVWKLPSSTDGPPPHGWRLAVHLQVNRGKPAMQCRDASRTFLRCDGWCLHDQEEQPQPQQPQPEEEQEQQPEEEQQEEQQQEQHQSITKAINNKQTNQTNNQHKTCTRDISTFTSCHSGTVKLHFLVLLFFLVSFITCYSCGTWFARVRSLAVSQVIIAVGNHPSTSLEMVNFLCHVGLPSTKWLCMVRV